MNKQKFLSLAGGICFLSCAGAAQALPALQLGPAAVGSWSYDGSDQTWVVSDSSFALNAYANCQNTVSSPCAQNGDYAWDTSGAVDQYAYLVVATVPDVGNVDAFDISISNDTTSLSMLTSGYGAPPLQDPNSLASHGIFDTYFEIYEFQFNGDIGTIFDTQPGQIGSGDGYTESFDITINSLLGGLAGIHFDLFTVQGSRYDPAMTGSDRNLVNAFAPFSHDAESCCTTSVPEPATAFLLGLGLLGLARARKLIR
ncbi:MAG: choice-of-anchor N protein [Gammaproteobacteria bacterium]|nr:choice-of-anchor N protein [Gammaproteobacteria bacterium]